PGIEPPGNSSDLIVALNKRTARIARPHTVGRPAMKADVSVQRIRSVENLLYPSLRRSIVDDQLNPFMFGKVPNDLGIHPGDGVELSRPIIFIVRPRQPGRGVRFPLAREADSTLAFSLHPPNRSSGW